MGNLYDGCRGQTDNVEAGDKLPLQGLDAVVVSSNGQTLASAINGGGPNAFCQGAQQKPADTTVNQRSLGFLLTFGKFKFLDVGDLTWDKFKAWKAYGRDTRRLDRTPLTTPTRT